MIRSRSAHISAVVLLGAIAASCSGNADPSGPALGSLAVAVSGLPAGLAPDVTVTGPGGYAHDLAASVTLSGLTPGTYTVAAAAVSNGGAEFDPSPSEQTVEVTEGSTAASTVAYQLLAGTLTVNIAGLPPGTAASVTVTGPNAYSTALTAGATLAGLPPGVYTVTAASVSSGGTSYDPTPPTQSTNVLAGATATATVGYAAVSQAALNLRIDGMYLTQSVQTYTGGVPLVQDRDGFLRVFVTATAANLAQPQVRVRFFNAGSLVSEVVVPAPGPSVPLSPNQSSLTASWNVPVPKALIQPNLSILAEVDPNNTVAESDETDNAFPASGTPLAMDVRPASAFAVRMVPVIQSVNGRQGNVTNGNKATYLIEALKLHPLASIDADLRAPYTTDAPAVTAGNDHGEWATILSEVDALRVADGSSRYYYGVVDPTYSSGVAGIGYVGGRTAIGWDLSGADEVAAHEWGHNWGRQHAPCGGASNPDPNFPYAGGSIGVYGVDVASQTLMPPSSADLMGYCSPTWISDYTYKAVLNWRSSHPDVVSGASAAFQPCLLVWGHVDHGEPVLEPAFEIVTRPSLPAGGGAYRVAGVSDDGVRLFDLAFTPETVADDPRGGQHFAFAVPLPTDRAARVSQLRLSTPGGAALLTRAAAPSVVTGPRARRVDLGRVRVDWDTARHPMAIVRDAATGQILSFARGGHAEVASGAGEVTLELSDGITSRSVRVPVSAR